MNEMLIYFNWMDMISIIEIVGKHGVGLAFLIKSIINYTIIEQLTVDVENVFNA